MAVQTPEARSVKPQLTVEQLRQECLNMIPGQEIKPFFIRPHLKREFIIGLIGNRGDGKSGSGGTISLVDFGIRNVPIWSNMDIHCTIDIDDMTARRFGLRKGGSAHYQSKELDKNALLDLDERYTNSFIWIDEINVGYSNVRKTQTNTNVDFNTVIQELRKFHTSMGYSVIDEMFIDPQLRSMTDVFVKCEDTALSVEGLSVKKPTGIDFKWVIYPMSGYLVGRENSYYVTKHPLPPVFFHFMPWRGTYDTNLFQRKGKYSMTAREKEKMQQMEANISVDSSQEVVEQYNEWGWLEERALLLKRSEIEYLEAAQLWDVLKIAEHHKSPQVVSPQLQQYGISKHHQNKFGQWVFRINNFDIEKSLTNSFEPVAAT